MGRNLRGAVAAAVATALTVSTGAGAAVSPEYRARMAARYVVDHQNPDGSIPTFSTIGSTADGVISLVAVRRGPKAINDAIDYLRSEETDVDTIGEKAKVVMALVAAGEDPRTFEGRNLLDEIRSTQTSRGRFGADTSVFDHALALLAFGSVGGSPRDAAEWLADAQCRDGGWQYDAPSKAGENDHCFSGDASSDFFKSDTNTTALAIQALAITARREELKRSPFRFIKAIRDEVKGGWGYTWGFRLTDSNSTALVLQAYAAWDRDMPKGARRALRALQHRLCGRNAGAFAYSWDKEDGTYKKQNPNLGATVGAILGLLRRPLPVGPADVDKAPPQPSDC